MVANIDVPTAQDASVHAGVLRRGNLALEWEPGVPPCFASPMAGAVPLTPGEEAEAISRALP